MLYPIQFVPRVKERVWGGQRLTELFGKPSLGGVPVGESWEVSDRSGDESVIANGSLAGRNIRWLLEHHGAEIFGRQVTGAERFPWLAKILDARDDLSLQVHPPAKIAGALRGEPKTEIWYVAAAEPEAVLYVGLKRGVTRAEFERKIADGTVAECFHQVKVIPGDVMFLPSGRVHALGKGIVIFEIQQNSDTTYRVFDWNRAGLDGRPRDLHVAESLISIDFQDFEPSLVSSPWREIAPRISRRTLVDDTAFSISLMGYRSGTEFQLGGGTMRLIVCASGALRLKSSGESMIIPAGGFALLPASIETSVSAEIDSQAILVEEPKSGRT